MFYRFVTLLAIITLAVAAPQVAKDAPHTGSNAPQTGSNAPGVGSTTPKTGNVSQCAASSQYCCNQKFSVRHLSPAFPRATYESIVRRTPPNSLVILAVFSMPSLVLLYPPGLPAPPSVPSVLAVLVTAPTNLRAAPKIQL